MNRKQVINQLESLKDNSESFIEEIEPESIWRNDVIALDYAISVLKKDLQPPSKSSPIEDTSNRLYHENEVLETGARKICLISKDDLIEIKTCIDKANELLKGDGLGECD